MALSIAPVTCETWQAFRNSTFTAAPTSDTEEDDNDVDVDVDDVYIQSLFELTQTEANCRRWDMERILQPSWCWSHL